MRNPQPGDLYLAGADVSIGHERRQCKALPGGVGLGVRKIVIGAKEIGDLPLLQTSVKPPFWERSNRKLDFVSVAAVCDACWLAARLD